VAKVVAIGNAATEVFAATLPCRIVMAVHRVKVAARKRNNDQLEIAMVAKVAASTVEACSLVATLPCIIVMAVVQQKWLQKRRSYNQLEVAVMARAAAASNNQSKWAVVTLSLFMETSSTLFCKGVVAAKKLWQSSFRSWQNIGKNQSASSST